MLWFLVGSKLRQHWLWQQCFINPFLTVSAISCLNMNGMIGTSHTCSSKESLFALCVPPPPPHFFLHRSLFLLFTPSCKSKSRLGFNDGRSWSLGQTSVAAGGPCKVPLVTLSAPSPLYCPARLGDRPPSCLAQSSPQTLGLLLLPWPVPCAPPIPPRCSTQKCAPPLHSALCSCRASPIPPHVVLIFTQRTSVKTTNYVDTRAEFTQKPHTRSLLRSMCI